MAQVLHLSQSGKYNCWSVRFMDWVVVLNKLHPTVTLYAELKELGPRKKSLQNITQLQIISLRKLEPCLLVWAVRGSKNRTHFIHSSDCGDFDNFEPFIKSLKDRRAHCPVIITVVMCLQWASQWWSKCSTYMDSCNPCNNLGEFITSILQMSKLRHREVRWLVHPWSQSIWEPTKICKTHVRAN